MKILHDDDAPSPAALLDLEGDALFERALQLEVPLAIAPTIGVAFAGMPADERARRLRSLRAPDFELTAHDGSRFHSRTLRGRKALLVAWASW